MITTKIKLALGLVIYIYSSLLFSAENNNEAIRLETVRLQLKWFHAFQFAGYYAAKEQGFYIDEGLDVHILERNPELNIVNQVVSNEVQYGVEDTGIIVRYANGAPIIALAAIFQHNPLVFISKQSSGIISPYEMEGKRIMMYGKEKGAGSKEASLRALLVDFGLTQDKFTHVSQSFNAQDLIDNKIDVMSAYMTDQPFFFKSNHIKINIINPQNYGIDFYGDILFTSQSEITEHPNRAERFRRASLKGWQYALDHQEEIVKLIHEKYDSRSRLEHLRFEAIETRKLILSEVIPLGQIEVKRLRKVANIYTHLKVARPLSQDELSQFIFNRPKAINLSQKEQQWLQKNPVIHLGLDRNFAPYEWLDEEGHYAGISIDYIKLLEQRLGVRFAINTKIKTRPELLNAAKQNQIQILFSLIQTPERSTYLNFTSPYFISPAIIISGQTQGYIGSLSRLNGKKVAIQKGHSTQELLSIRYPKISLILTNSIKEALEKVSEGKAHAYVGDATSSSYIMNQAGIYNLMFSSQTEYQSEFRIGVTKENPELLSILQKALASINQDEKNEIYNHWRELNIIQGIQYKEIIKYAIALLALLALFVYWIVRLRQSESALRKSKINLKAIFDAGSECIKVISVTGQVLRINPAGLELFESQDNPSAILGKKTEDLIIPENRLAFREMNNRVLKGESGVLIYQIESLKGHLRWVETHAVPFIEPSSGETTILALSRDITEKKRNDEKIWKHANFDSLTQLPNRRLFNDHLTHEIKLSDRSQTPLALLFLDLDHFKEVNDELGHGVGDSLLIETAQRITSCLRESDIVSRLSGDEFIVILSELEDKNTAERIAEKIIHILNQPFQLGDEIAYISVSIGIALYPDDANNSHDLLNNADLAMYSAKKMGRNRFSYFTQSMQDAALQRLQLLKELRVAVSQNQFQLRYQPIIELTSGKIKKIEALICWNHPTGKRVSPEEFIPIAEESGLMVEIGDWVFEESIRQLASWQKKFNNQLQISINKSPIQFNLRNDQYDWLHLLDNYNVKGENIVVEITENLLLDTSEFVFKRLKEYHDHGIQIAIDDFGTGYSALSYLNKFDIDYLKIDRSFIQNATPDSNDMALTEAITVMSHKLGFKVIVEGIETEQQMKLLKAAGCDYGQGYLFYKPMSAKELELIFEKQK